MFPEGRAISFILSEFNSKENRFKGVIECAEKKRKK